jgi:acetyl-CoA synthetase
MTAAPSSGASAFRDARDLLLRHRDDYDRAYAEFQWPKLEEFNWALDWFDGIAAGNERTALWVVAENGTEQKLSFAELSERSSCVASWLRGLGVARGDRIVVMLGNQVELWEALLAAMKLGAVVIPATTLLGPADLSDRVERGAARHVIAGAPDAPKFEGVPGDYTRIVVGDARAGWHRYGDADGASGFEPDGATRADDPLLLYFTSGTTAKPKLVEQTHASYPVGHLSTMYWIGLQPGDVHLNISSPGWAKHAWSNVFAPWNAEATVLVYNYARFDAAALLEQVVRCGATTFCAPPTVWRILIQADLGAWRVPLRELVGAGEPLNPEVIEQVRRAWGITIRDGYGQTETTAQIGNTPGSPVTDGSMGRPLPGYRVALRDPVGAEADEGEIALPLAERPLGLMAGYRDDPELTAEVCATATTTPAMSPAATLTASSRTSGARTTSSKRRITASRRSSWRASSSSTRRVRRLPSCRRQTHCDRPYRRRTSLWRRVTSRVAAPRSRSSPTLASTLRRTSAYAGSSSRSCRRG